MNRAALQAYIAEVYNADPEFLWERSPASAVFRHSSNRKWFALVMPAPKAKLGLAQMGELDVVNVKCDPIAIGSFRAQAGVFPAYHMSKASWLSVALDGSADDETIKLLLDISFALTAPKVKKPHAQGKTQAE